jgi:hypothetical protein
MTLILRYRLEGHTPVPDLDENPLPWAEWFETADRRVAETEVLDDLVAQIAVPELRPVERGTSRISTVFLGLDHNHGGVGPPILFETMVFGGPLDRECQRYATWDEAEAGHAEMVARVCRRASFRVYRGGKARKASP